MSESLIRYGVPGVWLGVGVLLWFWPSAVFVAFDGEDVTPGARLLGALFVYFGWVLGGAFVDPLPGGFVASAGGTLLVYGLLQVGAPRLELGPWGEKEPDPRTLGAVLAAPGLLLLAWTA
jgi:hypothetical protein